MDVFKSADEVRALKVRRAMAKYEKMLRVERVRQSDPDGGLLAFVRYFWDVLEPNAELMDGWPLEAVCTHLEAVTRGEIKRLLMNVPPGFMKSLLTDVFWPAWEWSAMDMPYLRYVAFSYAAHLTERDNGKFRDLLKSRKFQEMWGHKFTLVKDGETKVQNNFTGWKFASSVRGVGTGERGDRVVVDDPHNVKEGESEVVRSETVRWFRESLSDRFNNMTEGVMIVIMQRVHEGDVSGAIIEHMKNYCHLMIPMEFDPARACTTSIGWSDPRTEEGELAWPVRFPSRVVADIKIEKGPHAYAGQYQQWPKPRGGSIIKDEWWQLWDSPDGKFPVLEYVWAAADTAYTKKEENDPTGFTVWGLWRDKGQAKVILLKAWRKRLEIHGPSKWTEEDTADGRLAKVRRWMTMSRNFHKANGGPDPVIRPDLEPWASYIALGENAAERWPAECTPVWEERTQGQWGLCEWLAHSCRQHRVSELIIEGKASGLSVAQELRRLHGKEGWGIRTVTPEGDKVARLYAVQALFSAGLVYAPDRDWAQLVVEEVGMFPKGARDDLTDSTSMALKHIRDIGLLQRPEERVYAEEVMARHKSVPSPLYPA